MALAHCLSDAFPVCSWSCLWVQFCQFAFFPVFSLGNPLNSHLWQEILALPQIRQGCKSPLCKCEGKAVLCVVSDEEIVEKMTQSGILTDSARLARGHQLCKFVPQQDDNLLATRSFSGFSLTATGQQTTGELISSHGVCSPKPSQLSCLSESVHPRKDALAFFPTCLSGSDKRGVRTRSLRELSTWPAEALGHTLSTEARVICCNCSFQVQCLVHSFSGRENFVFITSVMPLRLYSVQFLSDTTDSVSVVPSRLCG